MSKEMIISVNGREKKIAVLDNGKVTEFYIERGEENSGVVGNIYKGRVQRVLPGMQSAFVEIGLERDGFLYVSDFFDEEEEIERIVMEKSKKSTPEEAKKEADEQIERARLEREKQMEAVQEIAEPLVESDAEDYAELETEVEEELFGEEPREIFSEEIFEKISDEQADEAPKGKRGKSRRGKKGKLAQETETAPAERNERRSQIKEESAPAFEPDDSSFERVVDDEDTGEMFKDAYRQEAIFDKVRAVEFDMESAGTAEVGSLINSVSGAASGFERIADEDDAEPQAETKKSRGRRGGKGKKKGAPTGDTPEPEIISEWIAPAETASETSAPQRDERQKSKKSRSPKSKNSDGSAKAQESSADNETGAQAEAPAQTKSRKKSRGGKKPKGERLEDGEASVKDSGDTSQMAARRGGRGRRGGRARTGQEGKTDERESNENELPAPPPAPKFQGSNGGGGSERKYPERARREERRERPAQPTITDLLREGQEILVQIAKEPIARKGARITSHIALPGRFLVYMPTIEHLGVSRKIESSSERGRLRTLIQKIRAEEDVPSGGFIVRTAGVGISEEDLRQDARYLVRTWLDVKKASEKKKSPALVHQDLDIIQRLLRDHLSDEYTAIRVDSEEEYLRIVEFINRIQPRMVKRVKLYTRDEPILEAFNVQDEIEKALKPRVWLKSGGYLVINQTEALVAIDVNTGKFVGKGNARLEDTITKTNMEAVEEIARQIRLRDLGGIIVLDLIDMEDRRNRHKVMSILQDALSTDKSPTKVLSYNDFGLIIMTRKRVKQSLERTLCSPCEYCEGAGWVKSPQTVCYEILEEARRLSRNLDDVKQTTLRTHPEVSSALRNTEQTVLEEIEAYLGNVDITSDPSIHQNQFDFAFV
ncbi:MAG TPA: Rne/Rng family ribonuclease [Pyrinomonadaceae bacterium]|jgi:ribonuclease G